MRRRFRSVDIIPRLCAHMRITVRRAPDILGFLSLLDRPVFFLIRKRENKYIYIYLHTVYTYIPLLFLPIYIIYSRMTGFPLLSEVFCARARMGNIVPPTLSYT